MDVRVGFVFLDKTEQVSIHMVYHLYTLWKLSISGTQYGHENTKNYF